MDKADSSSLSRQTRLNRIMAEYVEAIESGTPLDRQDLLRQHPDLAAELEVFLADQDTLKGSPGQDSQAGQMWPAESGREALTVPPGKIVPSVRRAPSDSASGTGLRRFGDYELLEEIARGGMGVVYKARQISLNRIVALKMILAGQLAGEADVRRFHSEAAAAAHLDHPGIVPIFEVGEHEGQHYFSMGYVQRQSLAARTSDGPLPSREAAELTMKIAEAVAYAHVQGVIHRDLKPANVLLDQDGQPRVTDFGLAKRVEGDHDLTATGEVLGTPGYMSPEQAAGKTAQIGPVSDIYCVGAILYELLTGRPPFKAATPLDTLMQVLENEPVPPRLLSPKVPRDLETICMKCLQKDPLLRYATAGELADDLNRFLEGELIHASSINLLDRVSRALSASQHDEHFQGWGLALICFGAVIFLAHVVMYVLVRAEYGPLVAYWIPRGVMLAMILALLWCCRPHSMLPTGSAERPIWALWIGYLIAAGALNSVVRLQGFSHTKFFAFAAILTGFGFFVMGSHVWGGSYAIGLAFLAAAPLLAHFTESSVLWFGTLWGFALLMLGGHYWRLGRRGRAGQRLKTRDLPEKLHTR